MARQALSKRSVNRVAREAFGIEGVDELQNALADMMDEMTGKEVKEIHLRGAMILRNQARANAPFDPKRKKGHHLREAIYAARGDANNPAALVGVNYKMAPHAHLVEFGTVRQPGQAYMRPAVTQKRDEIARTIIGGYTKIIERNS